MSPSPTEKPEQRVKVLKAIAHCFDRQRSYHLACRKYSQVRSFLC